LLLRQRELLASNKDLARNPEALERSLVTLDLKTQRQFKEVYDAIRALTEPPPAKHPQGIACFECRAGIVSRCYDRESLGFVVL
jgi:hypothetical protein